MATLKGRFDSIDTMAAYGLIDVCYALLNGMQIHTYVKDPEQKKAEIQTMDLFIDLLMEIVHCKKFLGFDPMNDIRIMDGIVRMRNSMKNSL